MTEDPVLRRVGRAIALAEEARERWAAGDDAGEVLEELAVLLGRLGPTYEDARAGSVERARLDGAQKAARAAAHQLNTQLSYLTGYGSMLASRLSGADRGMAEEIVRGAEEAAALLRRLQRIVRWEETDLGGGPMLDLDAAESSDRGTG